MKLYALSLAYLQYFFNWRCPLFLMHNNKWLWVLISIFYLISGWCDNFSLNQKEIPVRKILDAFFYWNKPICFYPHFCNKIKSERLIALMGTYGICNKMWFRIWQLFSNKLLFILFFFFIEKLNLWKQNILVSQVKGWPSTSVLDIIISQFS